MLQALRQRWKSMAAGGRPSGWVAVEVEPQGLRAVVVRLPGERTGRPQVLHAATVAATEPGPDAVAQLAASLGQPGFEWTLLCERQSYRLLVLEEPSTRPEEMAQSVRWLAGAMLDYPPEEAAMDHMRIPTREFKPEGPHQLYVVAARREVIDGRARIFREAGVPLSCVDIREAAQRNVAGQLEQPGQGLALVSAGEGGVQMTFTFRGELYLDRFLAEPLSALTEADDWTRVDALERIGLQVQRSLEAVCSSFPFMQVERVVVGPAPAALLESLRQTLPLPVEALDLAAMFDLSDVPQLADPQEQARYFPVLGAALRGMEAPA